MNKDTETKGYSLSWRIALTQIWQVVWAYVRTNLLLILLFTVGLFAWSEWVTGEMYEEVLANASDAETGIINHYNTSLTVRPVTAEEIDTTVFLPEIVPFGVPAAYRTFFTQQPQNVLSQYLPTFHRYPVYTITIPTATGKAWMVHIPWETPIALFCLLMAGLLVLQLLSLPFVLVRMRNKVRKSLQPIYELTATAQNISASDYTLPLSGTIDALNTISATDFDRRIPILHEREELKGLAQAINDMLDRLDASYKAQLRFVSDASHELRTPISIIQGYARLIKRWGKDDPTTLEESIDAIDSETENMKLLVEQLLLLARSDNQSLQLNPQLIPLSELMQEVEKETAMIAKQHHFTSSFSPNIYLYADLQLVKQAIRILVDNSIKYTPEGGAIHLELSEQQQEVAISVTDSGIGIESDKLESIFGRFWRADESRDRKTGGTGLGLSIARLIAESHSGYISVVSREGIGSKFTLVLPQQQASASPILEPEQPNSTIELQLPLDQIS